MVADLLPGHVERARDAGRGPRLGEHREDAGSEGSKQDSSFGHGRNSAPAYLVSQGKIFVGSSRHIPSAAPISGRNQWSSRSLPSSAPWLGIGSRRAAPTTDASTSSP